MPKIVPPLTANGIEKAHKQRIVKAMSDGAQPGLEFRVREHGSSWSLVASSPAGRKRITLGSYPEVGLAQARELAAAARKKIKSATDESRKTLAELVGEYGAVTGERLRTWDDQRGVMAWVFKGLWETPCGELTVARVQRVVDAHPARIMGARALGYLRPVLSWGRKRGFTALVSDDLDAPKGVNKRRERVLSPAEQKRVIPFLRDNLDVAHYRVMWLLLLTACRLNEIAEASWEDVSLADATLRVPKERSKNGVALLIPLPRQAVACLGVAGSGRIFPALNNWSRYQARAYKATQTSGWHRHDLRRTTATIAGELGYAPHVIDVALGHVHLGSAAHSHYNMTRYLPEHRDALQAIADYYSKITH